MKYKLLFLAISFVLTTQMINAQGEQCGTMKNLQQQIQKDPNLENKLQQLEKQSEEWIRSKGIGLINYNETNKPINSTNKSSLNTNSLCGYDNTYFTTIVAPLVLNQSVSPTPNCTYGGEFVRISNLLAGRTYKISTCGLNNFDTQITIYPAGGGSAIAFNDDWCGTQSEIYFTPSVGGDYDVLVDEYNCSSNSLCASLSVALWYIPRPVISIPVVVHVIHNGEAIGIGRNISDAQINSQIAVLNEDYRRQNVDFNTVPAPFKGESADPLIQFCLAQQDPNGMPTNGILRYPVTSQTSFDIATINSIIKPNTIWNRDKYLNLWVLEFGGTDTGTLGYAQFPGGDATTDGVVVLYNAFGKVGNLQSNYNLGRTATHEVGHWLNLKHIWGDEDACAADDLVSDTPLQGVNSNAIMSTNACPVFPITDTCTISYPGIMFMNYMDYGYHQCKKMYTYGQFVRIETTLFNERIGLQTSQGCMPSALGLNTNSLKNEFRIYPNPTKSNIFIDSVEKYNSLEIYNILGQVVQSTSIINKEEVDLTGLSAGTYILKFKNLENVKTVKIVKE